MKPVIVGDLFKIYFYEDRRFIEILRPITKEDFTIISPESNAERFINESNWYYQIERKTVPHYGSNSGLSESRINSIGLAKFSVKLSLWKELIAHIPSLDLKTSIKNFHHVHALDFNYKGCDTPESKEQKNIKILKCLKEWVEKHHEEVENHKYERAIIQIQEGLKAFNDYYTEQMKQEIVSNENLHKSIQLKYPQEVIALVEDISFKRNLISTLEKEIYNLSLSVEKTHKVILENETSLWEGFPESIVPELKGEIPKIQVKGYAKFPNGRDLVYIKDRNELKEE